MRKHITATTDAKEGTFRKIADHGKLTAFGSARWCRRQIQRVKPCWILSAAVCGIDIEQLLAGARYMDRIVSNEDFYKNPAAINAAINYHFYNKGKKISVMMPYSACFEGFGRLVQAAMGGKPREGKRPRR